MERFVIPQGAMDNKYLEDVLIECLTPQGTEFLKTPDINIIECGKINNQFAVFFRDGEKVHIIHESEKQNDAEIVYQKTVNVIITAYNNRKKRRYTGSGKITQSDIQNTLFSVTPNIE